MTEILIISLMVVLTLLSVAISISFFLELLGWVWTGVPYIPVPKHVLKRLPEVLNITDESVVYDLGCGDGRVLFELAKQSNAQCIGVEKAPLPYLLAKIRTLFSRRKNVRIVYGDIYTVPIKNATHVYVYLFSELMEKLLPTLTNRVGASVQVVSCDFQFKNKEPVEKISFETKNRGGMLYVYNF